MEETRVYSCPSCGAPMKYSISSEKLKCRFCCNTYDLEYIRTHFTEVGNEKLSDFDWVDRTKYVWEPYDQEYLEEFECPSCGGKISTKAYYGTAKCPYCKHDLIISSDFDGDIRPDNVIPFKVTKDEFIEKYKNYISKFKKAPSHFKNIDAEKDLVGCYVPVWCYSCLCGEGNNDPTYRPLWTKGYPILANETDISKDVFYTILPYEFSEAEKFTESCLTGFPASRYIIGAENAMKTTDKEIKGIYYSQKKVVFKYKSERKELKDVSTEEFIDSLEGFRLDNDNISYRKLSYYLVPVWLLDITYNNEKYTFAMNGQIGQMRVDRVPKKRCSWFYSLIILLILILISILIYNIFSWLGHDLEKIILAETASWMIYVVVANYIVNKLKKRKVYFRSVQFKQQKTWSVNDFIIWDRNTDK